MQIVPPSVPGTLSLWGRVKTNGTGFLGNGPNQQQPIMLMKSESWAQFVTYKLGDDSTSYNNVISNPFVYKFHTISYSIQLTGRPYTHLTMQSTDWFPHGTYKGCQWNTKELQIESFIHSREIPPIGWVFFCFILLDLQWQPQDCNRFQSCTQGKPRLVKGKVVSFIQEAQEMNRLPCYKSRSHNTHSHLTPTTPHYLIHSPHCLSGYAHLLEVLPTPLYLPHEALEYLHRPTIKH